MHKIPFNLRNLKLNLIKIVVITSLILIITPNYKVFASDVNSNTVQINSKQTADYNSQLMQGMTIRDGLVTPASYSINSFDELRVYLDNMLSETNPAVSYLAFDEMMIGNDYGIPQNDYNAAMNKAITCKNWVDANMQYIVPQGTSYDKVPNIIANWVSDCMSYDYSAYSQPALLRNYQSAYEGFVNQKGVCTTYSNMFMIVLHEIPINSSTLTVDYGATNPLYYQVHIMYSAEHSWSAYRFNRSGVWTQCDITNYDSAIRDGNFLNLPSTYLVNYPYQNPEVILPQ